MSEKQFRLEVVTPIELKFEGEVQQVQLPGVDGEVGVLASHAPLLSLLSPGVLSYRAQGLDYPLAVGGGFVKVAANKVVVMVDSAERPEEIDGASVEAERRRLLGALEAGPGAVEDFDRLRAQLAMALARLKVLRR